MGALALIIALLAWLVAALRRSGLRASTALVPASGNPPPLTQQAALAELTEFAKRSLVQGLYEQRNALLETQKQAQHALVELEQRLAALHLPQQERIRAYERRIAELEKELDTRGEEVRELTQATLLLVRRRLQEEKGLGRSRDQFN
jgi:vacuolar-type H+-ATPase subunit I/STV1